MLGKSATLAHAASTWRSTLTVHLSGVMANRCKAENSKQAMSPLGQKQTSQPVRAMSALPPKADMELSRGMSALCHKETFCTAAETDAIRWIRRCGDERKAPAKASTGIGTHFGYLAVRENSGKPSNPRFSTTLEPDFH